MSTTSAPPTSKTVSCESVHTQSVRSVCCINLSRVHAICMCCMHDCRVSKVKCSKCRVPNVRGGWLPVWAQRASGPQPFQKLAPKHRRTDPTRSRPPCSATRCSSHLRPFSSPRPWPWMSFQRIAVAACRTRSVAATWLVRVRACASLAVCLRASHATRSAIRTQCFLVRAARATAETSVAPPPRMK